MTGLSLVAPRPERTTDAARTPVRQILEVLLGNADAAAAHSPEQLGLERSLSEAQALTVLCELAFATADLASCRAPRATVRLCADPHPWEIGIERAGASALITLFQGGALPEVAFFERRTDGDALAERIVAELDRLARHDDGRRGIGLLASAAIPGVVSIANDASHTPERAAERASAPSVDASRILAAKLRLDASPPFGAAVYSPVGDAPLGDAQLNAPPSDPTIVSVEPTGEMPIVIAADVALRAVTPAGSENEPAVQRTDLFSLLFRGRVRVTIGRDERELGEVFVFPLAEQLGHLALEALEAWICRRPYHRRLSTGGAILGVRLLETGAASLTLGLARKGADDRAHTWTFPAVDVGALVQGVVAFGRALTRSLVRRDRAQSSNYRLFGFRSQIRELADRLREATRDDSKINAAPEAYRAFAALSRPAAPSAADGAAFGRARLRFSTRWLTAVPSIDLRSTFLCGDLILAGGAREISCLDRKTGELVWCRPEPRAVSVLTPVGLARLLADGSLHLHDIATGDVTWSTRLTPRSGGSASGAVVSAPNLPRMLIVSEGARHLAALDLYSGEVRWRYAARRGGVFRLKRAGKLVVVASGEPALTALDVLTGAVVWRFCDRLRFASNVAVDNDALFALAGDGAFVGRGGTRLHHIDPWSGAPRWSVDLPGNTAPIGAPLLAPETVIAVTHGRRGTGLLGFDRRTGELRFDISAAASAASCLVVDDMVVVNSEGGELAAIDAGTGSTRYRHVFSGGVEGDRPRRLEPVLRSGALFVPQSEVHVVRPRDGTLLGKIPSEIIPDLLRVDERCDVYVAEESGHVGAFTAAPRLSLVST